MVDGLAGVRGSWPGATPTLNEVLAVLEALARLAALPPSPPEQRQGNNKEPLTTSSMTNWANLVPSPNFVRVFLYYASGEDHLSNSAGPGLAPTHPDPGSGAAFNGSTIQTPALSAVSFPPRVRRAAVAVLAASLPALCARAATHRATCSAAVDGTSNGVTTSSAAAPSVVVDLVADVLRASVNNETDATARLHAFYGLVNSGFPFSNASLAAAHLSPP